MTTPLTPLAFTERLVEHLSQVRPTEQAIADAKDFLRARRELRGDHQTKERGYEHVVEIMLRSTITRFAEHELLIPSESHRRIYSSHYHTTNDSEGDYRARWRDFRRDHPDVDTYQDGHLRRADLFISMGTAGLVSFEFKYLRPESKPTIPELVGQVRQHLTKHRACVLVLYAATPIAAGVESAARAIRDELRGCNGFVVVMTGPPIKFP